MLLITFSSSWAIWQWCPPTTATWLPFGVFPFAIRHICIWDIWSLRYRLISLSIVSHCLSPACCYFWLASSVPTYRFTSSPMSFDRLHKYHIYRCSAVFTRHFEVLCGWNYFRGWRICTYFQALPDVLSVYHSQILPCLAFHKWFWSPASSFGSFPGALCSTSQGSGCLVMFSWLHW